MDAFCRLLSVDLYCLLTQIKDSLGVGSTNLSVRTERKKGQKKRDQEFNEREQELNKRNQKLNERVQEKKGYQMKNKNHEGVQKENPFLKKNHFQKENHYLVMRPSHTIRHNYPGPLTTYDGEERGEPRLIRLSDLRSSQVEMILNICGDQDEKEEECEVEEEQECEEKQDKECEEEKKQESKKKPKQECEAKQEQGSKEKQDQESKPCRGETSDKSKEREEFFDSKKEEFESVIKDFLAEKRGSVSFGRICSEDPPKPRQLMQKEHRARTLYEKSICQNPEAPAIPWDRLKYTEKLRFHWKAHMGWELQETPFDNFRLSYIRNRRRICPKMGIRKVRSEMRLRWCNMDRRGRMPFMLQALLYQVTRGALDPADHCAVREFFQKVK